MDYCCSLFHRVTNRCRQVLHDFNMSCDEVGCCCGLNVNGLLAPLNLSSIAREVDIETVQTLARYMEKLLVIPPFFL